MPSLVPLIPITLDKPRALRLDNQALLLAERELSKLWERKLNILQVLLDAETLGLNDLCVLLWAGLRHEDPDLSLAQVQEAVSIQDYIPLLQALFSAWNSATAPADGAPEGTPVPLAPASPGSATGVLPGSSLASAMTPSGA